MNKEYFVLDLAHSLHGQVKRIQVGYKSIAWTAGCLLALALISFGLFSSYLRMSWKVSKYDHLSADFENLRKRYTELQRQSNQHREQMASLETLASEVSAAYGINQPASSAPSGALDGDGAPNLRLSIEQYNFLESASYSGTGSRYVYGSQSHNAPTLWPVDGTIRSSFGARLDPFSGDSGTFHTGIDLQAPSGTPVHVSGDGVVESAGWSGGYGKLVVIDHGNGIETYYAHLSEMIVLPGEDVRRGEIIALSGGTGHATGPHVHYEVRLGGTPVNPYRYLAKARNPQTAKITHSDLGL